MPTEAEPQVPRQLTTREEQILRGLAEGKSQTTIARELDVSRQWVHQIVERLRLRGVIDGG